MSSSIERFLYSGLAVLAGSFFLFYSGPLLGFDVQPNYFLAIALAGFQMLIVGRILSANRKELILLIIVDSAFTLAAVSLIVNTSFEFGRWDYFTFITLLFVAFVTGGFLPDKKVRPQDYGVTGAFVMSFFFEMFGFPLTLFLINVILGISLPLQGREALESAHLWVTIGLMSGPEAHFISASSVMMGVVLIVLGHQAIHIGRGAPVKSGIFRYIKHPQYLGIIVLTGGMLVEYPTFPTLAMWFVLISLYANKARKESREISIQSDHA